MVVVNSPLESSGLNKAVVMLSSPLSRCVSEMRDGRKSSRGLCSNPFPAGQATAACPAFHNPGDFKAGREGGREGGLVAFLHHRGQQRRPTTSKATQSLGVDDCNPPLCPLLATQTLSPSTCAHSAGRLCQVCANMCDLCPPSVPPGGSAAVPQEHSS